jgi:hypothetical protein
MRDHQADSKVQYEVPTLVRIGTFEAITHASGGHTSLDAPFPTGTPAGDLTFS